MKGIASFENFGSVLRLPIFPPTTIATPSSSGLCILIGGHTVKQFPQYMHLSSFMVIVLSLGFGLIAAVGHEPIVVGISQDFVTIAWSTTGGFLWTATTAMSEQ